MIDDRELWACALAVLRQHPDDAEVFTAERLGALAQAGDEAGLNVWLEIAQRINRLVYENEQPPC